MMKKVKKENPGSASLFRSALKLNGFFWHMFRLPHQVSLKSEKQYLHNTAEKQTNQASNKQG